ncbi:MAG: hypothetical protein RBS21_03150 [Corynebacterium sp.]|jgi:membrane protease YdiL (CAAX protease family)|nr:hypothetical protein [Corynebacterium sp.]
MADAIRAGERDGERGVNGGAVPRLRPGFLGWAHPFIGVAAAAAVAMVLPVLLMMGSAAGSGAGSGALQTPPWTTLAQFSLLAVIVALVLFGARRKAARRRAETVPTATTATPVSPTASSSAADPTRPAPMLKSLLVVGVISIVFAIAANLLLDTPGIESPKAIVNQLGLGKAAWSDLLIIAGVAMAAPIGEELALRGLVFRGIFDAVGRKRVPGRGHPVGGAVRGHERRHLVACRRTGGRAADRGRDHGPGGPAGGCPSGIGRSRGDGRRQAKRPRKSD